MIELMKFDMGGCAAVLGCAKAISQLKPNVYNEAKSFQLALNRIIFSLLKLFRMSKFTSSLRCAKT